jgi:hypothetical protein
VSNLAREAADSAAQVARLTERIAGSERRMKEIDIALVEGDLARTRLDDELGSGRARLTQVLWLRLKNELFRDREQVPDGHLARGV